MTAAERLTAAADLLEQRANAATPPADPHPGGWAYGFTSTGWVAVYGGPAEDGYRSGTVFEFKDEADCEECIRPSVADADYIVTVHPGVGLALAAWLRAESESRAEFERFRAPRVLTDLSRAADATADAILGGES